MKATYIPTTPPNDSQNKGVTPECLAAVLAKYSRSNEGIETLLEKSAGKSPDAIFKFVDYGHASIGGLTGGIAIAIDDISILLAYKLFELSQMADGQESSTRYIKLNKEGVVNATDIGIPQNSVSKWEKMIELGFEIYEKTSGLLKEQVEKDPSIARIPKGTPDKVKDRMLQNYALDRARYFLPVACKTNMALVMSARMWAETIKNLESLQWKEAITTADLIRKELEKASPNLIRHSSPTKASLAQTNQQLKICERNTTEAIDELDINYKGSCQVNVFNPPCLQDNFSTEYSEAFEGKENRYSPTGVKIKRQTVQMEWDAIPIAELRDLNRHRTGFRYSTLAAHGFYIPKETIETIEKDEELTRKTKQFFEAYIKNIKNFLEAPNRPLGIQCYNYFLGTQVPFEHIQQADKFLYEVELRTGLGAHFKYAEIIKEAAEIYFTKEPQVKEFVTLGEAEPE